MTVSTAAGIDAASDAAGGEASDAAGGEAPRNAALVRRLVEALNARDAPALVALLTDDAVWHFPGRNAMAGDHAGIPAIGAFLRGVAERMRGTPVLEVHDISATDRHATELTRITLDRGSSTFAWWTFRAYHFRDGRISEIFATTDEQYLLDELIGTE